MTADLTPALALSAIPQVLDEGEAPFVLGFEADPRPKLEAGGAEYRRASDRVVIDWKLGEIQLRAYALNEAGGTYLCASAGPMLVEWWPALLLEGGNAARPLLSAAIAGRPVEMRSNDLTINVSIVGPGPDVPMVAAVVGIEAAASITELGLLLTHRYSLAVIKAALVTLVEYRGLVNPVPDVEVATGGRAIALAALLDTATQAADAIQWSYF